MHSFVDNAGRTWTVVINVVVLKRVRAVLGLDLLQLFADGAKPLADLLSDPVRLVDVVYCVCKDEADKRNISDEDFGRAMFGDAIEKAGEALVEELIDFFPNAQIREQLLTIISLGKQLKNLMIQQIAEEIKNINLGQVVQKLKDSSMSLQA